jgi:hypothetical protein
LRLGNARALQFEEATFDTVVCTLSEGLVELVGTNADRVPAGDERQ